MGNSYTAVSDDYSAVHFNPAGLGLIKRMELSSSMNYNSLENNVDFFNNSTDYSNSSTNLSQIGFVFPFPVIRGSLVFAFGYDRYKNFNGAVEFNGYNSGDNSMIQFLTAQNDFIPYELGLSYRPQNSSNDITEIDGDLNQSGSILEDGGLNKWSLAGAVEVSKNVFVGLTLNILTGSYKSNREYYEDDTRNVYGANDLIDPNDQRTADFQTFYLNDIVDWDLSGYDLKLGLLYKLNKNVNVGATIKFPSQYTVKENYFVDAYSEFGNASFALDPPYDEDIEYDISTPFVFSGGASFKVANLMLSLGVDFTDYTQMEYTDGLDAGKRSQNNRDIKEEYRAVAKYNVGFEYLVPMIDVSLRGGFMMNPSPFKDDPSQYDKKYITGGIGFMAQETLSLDIAYVYGWWENFGDNYGSGLSRFQEEITMQNFIFGVNYRF
jgi:long-subunit fatty acid transport protein